MEIIKDTKIAFYLAKKQISSSNKGGLFLTIIIMTLMYINLLFVSSLLLGVITKMNQQVIDMRYGNIVINPEISLRSQKNDDNNTYIKQVKEKMQLINSVEGVSGSSAHYVSRGDFSFDKEKDGRDVKTGNWPIISINPEDEIKTTNINEKIVDGEFLQASDRDKIIIGRDISGGYGSHSESDSLGGVEIGDEVTVAYKNNISRKYKVKGIFTVKEPGFDKMAFVTKKEMESVLSQNDMATEIVVKLDKTGEEEKYIEVFKEIGLGKEDIRSWKTYAGESEGMSESFKIIRLIVYIIGLTVAGITIFVVLYINLMHRKKQLGILKAIGMKNRIIIHSYILQAVFFTIMGVGFGVLIVQFFMVPYFIKNPLEFPMGDVTLIVSEVEFLSSILSLMIVSFIAGFIPSAQIVKKEILDSIYERA